MRLPPCCRLPVPRPGVGGHGDRRDRPHDRRAGPGAGCVSCPGRPGPRNYGAGGRSPRGESCPQRVRGRSPSGSAVPAPAPPCSAGCWTPAPAWSSPSSPTSSPGTPSGSRAGSTRTSSSRRCSRTRASGPGRCRGGRSPPPWPRRSATPPSFPTPCRPAPGGGGPWSPGGLRSAAALGPGRCLEVRCERLVREPEQRLTRTCAFLDLGYDEHMLGYHTRADEFLGAVGDRDCHDSVRRPPTRRLCLGP